MSDDDDEAAGAGVRRRRRRILIVLGGLAVIAIAVAVTAVVVRAKSSSSSACAQVADLRQREHDANVAYHTTVLDTAPTLPGPTVTRVVYSDGLYGPTSILSAPLFPPATGPRYVAIGTLEDWQKAYTVLAIAAEQNPSCFSATERAELEAGYRQLQAKP
jgi:hypothetical protein